MSNRVNLERALVSAVGPVVQSAWDGVWSIADTGQWMLYSIGLSPSLNPVSPWLVHQVPLASLSLSLLTLYTHTITQSHTHTHSLSLVLVVMIKSKELKTRISQNHSLILSPYCPFCLSLSSLLPLFFSVFLCLFLLSATSLSYSLLTLCPSPCSVLLTLCLSPCPHCSSIYFPSLPQCHSSRERLV